MKNIYKLILAMTFAAITSIPLWVVVWNDYSPVFGLGITFWGAVSITGVFVSLFGLYHPAAGYVEKPLTPKQRKLSFVPIVCVYIFMASSGTDFKSINDIDAKTEKVDSPNHSTGDTSKEEIINHSSEPKSVQDVIDEHQVELKEWADLMVEVHPWKEEHLGYYFPHMNGAGDYGSYDDEALEALGQQGDLKAYHVLGSRHLMQRDKKKARKYYKQAAVHGSTWALQELGKIKGNENEKKYLIRQLSYNQAAILRGDRAALMNSYHQLSDTKLTDSDKKAIQQIGAKIYERTKRQRSKLGLGEFSTPPAPESVKKYNAMMENNFSVLTTGDSPLFLSGKE